jgi:hypothetical protein
MTDKAKLEAKAAKYEKEARTLHAQRGELQAELEKLNERRPALLKALASGRDVSGELLKLNLKTDELTARAEGITLLLTENAEAFSAVSAELQEIAAAEAKAERERYARDLRQRCEASAAHVRELYRALAEARGALLLVLSELKHHDKPAAQAVAYTLAHDDELSRLRAAGWRELALPGFEGCSAWAIPAMAAPDPRAPFKGTSGVLDAEIVRVERAQAAA